MGIKAILFILILLISSLGCESDKYKIIEKTTSFPLEQLNLKGSSKETSGEFFLGCGSFYSRDISMYYFYIKENESFSLITAPYEKVKIQYTTYEEKPFAEFYARVVAWEFEYTKDVRSLMKLDSYYWTLHIPPGSIINQYDPNIK